VLIVRQSAEDIERNLEQGLRDHAPVPGFGVSPDVQGFTIFGAIEK